jgi:hypothetical protein
MSFDLNMVASSFKPKVENTFLGKGVGNGSTGYFNQRRKKQDENNASILLQNEGTDILEKIGDNINEDIKEEKPENILDKVKNLLKR